jgi:hypothetical protein
MIQDNGEVSSSWKKYTFDNSVIIKKKEVGQMQMGLHNQIQ